MTAAKADLPNILFIMADQHRFDCLGIAGNPDVRTPHLDSLARDGVMYDNGFCCSPVCTPSRYSILTGLYPHQHLGWSNHCTVQPGLATYPKLLKRAGYATMAVGKMHLTPTYQHVGFDDMRLAEQNGRGRYEDDYHRYLGRHGLIDRVDLWDQVKEYREHAPQEYWASYGAMASDLQEQHHSTAWIGREALRAIDQWDEGGNLLFASFVKPHHPFDPPKPWSDMYDAGELTVLPGWTETCLQRDLRLHPGFFPHEQLTLATLRQCMAYYYATISHMDHYIGQMIQLLQQKGLYENTLIIYTSDHGEYLGFHHMLLKQNYMYEPLVKVPFIMKYPGFRNKGQLRHQLASHIDIAVTLAAAAGLEVDGDWPGIDLSDPASDRSFVFCELSRGSQYMVRSERYKLIACKDEEQSLFLDLRADPYETTNLYRDPACQATIAEHRAALQQLILFDAPASVFLYEEAVQVQGGHNLASGQSRELFAEWVRERMC